MKRIITLLLCLVMMMSLAACGGSGTADESGETVDSQETVVSDNSTSSENSEEPTEIKKIVIDEAVKPENFQLSASGEDFESYTLENITYRDVMNYESKLIDNGFYIQRRSFGSEVIADTVAYEIKYLFQYSGTDYITSYTEFEERAKQGQSDPGNLTVTVRARDLAGYNLPSLPEEDWTIDDGGKSGWIICKRGSYVNCTKAERVALAKGYAETLKAAGYTVNAEEYPEGKELGYTSNYVHLYDFYAEDENGCTVELEVYEDLEFPYTQAGVDEWAGVEITFKRPKEEEKPKAASVLPELPEGEWDENKYSNGKERVTEYSLYLNDGNATEQAMPIAEDYVKTLKKSGYTLETEEYPNGNEALTSDSEKSIYYFTAKDANGAWVCVSVYEIPYTVETPAPPPAQIYISLHNPK